MRRLKSSGSYLKTQTRKTLGKAILCIFLFGTLFVLGLARLVFYLSFSLFEELLWLFSLAFSVGGYYYWHRFRIYNGGLVGERKVDKALNSGLNDDYYLINNLSFHKGGDVDHIVIGPNGVFVIETKNWSGIVSCNGDAWQREDQRKFKDSPSRQVKKNADKIKQIMSSSSNLRNHGIWVQGLVVFTNTNADLSINKPTTPILRLSELSSYITTYKNYNPYTAQQVQQIIKEITKQAGSKSLR
jgi:hypothetical protein